MSKTVEVAGLYRKSKYGNEFVGELLLDSNGFFVVKCKHGKYTFSKTTHTYSEKFTPPVPIGSYAHLSRKDYKSDDSWQMVPHRVIDYTKIGDVWNIVFDWRGQNVVRHVHDYDIIEIPSEIVACYKGN